MMPPRKVEKSKYQRWRLSAEVEHYRREQALFFHQYHALKRACGERGIHLMGDVPTEARREAVNRVVAAVLPGVAVKNELRVIELGGVGAPEHIE